MTNWECFACISFGIMWVIYCWLSSCLSNVKFPHISSILTSQLENCVENVCRSVEWSIGPFRSLNRTGSTFFFQNSHWEYSWHIYGLNWVLICFQMESILQANKIQWMFINDNIDNIFYSYIKSFSTTNFKNVDTSSFSPQRLLKKGSRYMDSDFKFNDVVCISKNGDSCRASCIRQSPRWRRRKRNVQSKNQLPVFELQTNNAKRWLSFYAKWDESDAVGLLITLYNLCSRSKQISLIES